LGNFIKKTFWDNCERLFMKHCNTKGRKEGRDGGREGGRKEGKRKERRKRKVSPGRE
jgi:hypothetical protein